MRAIYVERMVQRVRLLWKLSYFQLIPLYHLMNTLVLTLDTQQKALKVSTSRCDNVHFCLVPPGSVLVQMLVTS